MAFVKGNLCAKLVLRYVGIPTVLKELPTGDVSLDDLQEKLTGEVSLLKVLLENPIGDVSRNERRVNRVEEKPEEYSSVGENEGRNDLGSLGVDVNDREGR